MRTLIFCIFVSIAFSLPHSEAKIHISGEGAEQGSGLEEEDDIPKAVEPTQPVHFLDDTFLQDPESFTVLAGHNASIKCIPPRGNPHPNVIWKRDFRPISMLGNPRYQPVNGALNVISAQESDTGWYTCEASNSAGVQKRTVRLNVYGIPKETSHSHTVTAAEGESAVLSCEVASRIRLPMTIVWRRNANGGKLPNGKVEHFNGNLRLKNLHVNEAGWYECEVLTPAGKLTSKVELIVTKKEQKIVQNEEGSGQDQPHKILVIRKREQQPIED